jgi:hypothetical protein
MNKKAQTVPLSTVIVVMIIIVIVFSSYVWGAGLLDSYQKKTSINYMQNKLLDIKRNVLEVVREGEQSTRSMQIDASSGDFYISQGASCSGTAISSNFFAFNTTNEDETLIEAESQDTWVLLDTHDNSKNCSDNYTTHSPGVLIGKYTQSGGAYHMTYAMWFRNLTDDSGMIYAINLTVPSSASGQAADSVQTLSIRNNGVVRTATATVTNINLDIL